MPKLTWQERVQITERVHKSHLVENAKWRLEDTAKELLRSEGRVSEDLLLASWMKTDPKVERFKFVQEALDYVRKKKQEMRVRI
jgi:hypothetical protein